MKRQSRKKRSPKAIRLWTREQAEKAVPYLRSVMKSLRETWVEARSYWLENRRLTTKPGRLTRDAILAQQLASKEADLTTERLNEIVGELEAVDAFCLDPGRGLALVPFSHQDELAWLVFDLFSPQGFESWRFHKDPLELRRPLVEVDPQGSGPALPV